VNTEAFTSELEKLSGIREAARFLATGKSTLYHGTSRARAKAIRKAGLKPQGESGVSSVIGVEGEAGTAFTTRSKAEAKTYAQQQSGMDKVKRVRDAVTRRLGKDPLEGYDDFLEDQSGARQANLAIGRVLGTQGLARGKVVKMRVPYKELRKREGVGTELHGDKLTEMREGLQAAGVPEPLRKAVDTGTALAFARNVPVDGGIPKKYVVGAKGYERSSLKSVAEHLRDARKNPKRFGKEFLRNLTGVSHRPSTLYKQREAALARVDGD
jgi:hypothetical protein